MEGWLIRQELGESLRVPLLLLALFAAGMAFWLERTQAAASALSLIALPIVALRIATRAARESELALARLAVLHAFVMGALAVTALAQRVPALTFVASFTSFLPQELTTVLLAAGVLTAIPLEAALARRSVETRVAAWTGVVAAFAWIAPSMGGDTLEALFAAVAAAVVLGGGLGLALGTLARRIAGAKA